MLIPLIPGGIGNMYRIPNPQNEVVRIDRQVRVSNEFQVTCQLKTTFIFEFESTILKWFGLFFIARYCHARKRALIDL